MARSATRRASSLMAPSTTAHCFDRGLSFLPIAATFDQLLSASFSSRSGGSSAAPWSPKASAPLCPERDQQMSRKESRGRRDPSQQGRRFTAKGSE